MEYRRLGKSGLKLSALSFGSWVTFGTQVDDSLATELLRTAFEAGVNFFDNAEVYAEGQSEIIMGRVLKKLGFPRDQFCVSSKVFWGGEHPTQNGLSRKHVTEACHAALRRLQVDYLDLYFCHRPDPETPIEETVWAMHNLVAQGKVLYWGTSEWAAAEIEEAYRVAERHHLTPPTMEQPQYNLFCRERVETEYAPLYRERGMGTTIWSPLASGVLTGKYSGGKIPDESRMALEDYQWLKRRFFDDPTGREKLKGVDRFAELARELDATPATLAIAWCLKNPNVSTVILGASRVTQLQENLKALAVLPRITPEVTARIERIWG